MYAYKESDNKIVIKATFQLGKLTTGNCYCVKNIFLSMLWFTIRKSDRLLSIPKKGRLYVFLLSFPTGATLLSPLNISLFRGDSNHFWH